MHVRPNPGQAFTLEHNDQSKHCQKCPVCLTIWQSVVRLGAYAPPAWPRAVPFFRSFLETKFAFNSQPAISASANQPFVVDVSWRGLVRLQGRAGPGPWNTLCRIKQFQLTDQAFASSCEQSKTFQTGKYSIQGLWQIFQTILIKENEIHPCFSFQSIEEADHGAWKIGDRIACFMR